MSRFTLKSASSRWASRMRRQSQTRTLPSVRATTPAPTRSVRYSAAIVPQAAPAMPISSSSTKKSVKATLPPFISSVSASTAPAFSNPRSQPKST